MNVTTIQSAIDITNLIIIVAALLVVVLSIGLLRRLLPSKLDKKRFQERWQILQRLCANEETWPLAIIDADKLLDEALKRSGFRGRTMGERLVAAQRKINDNDGVWFAHKLRNRTVHEETVKLKKRDVQTALHGFRDALKDLGAL